MRQSQAVVGASMVLVFTLACGGGGSAPAGAAAARPAPPGAPPEIDGKTPLPDPLPDVAAIVNGQPVAMRNVKLLAEQTLRAGGIPPDQKAFAYRKVANQFVIRELLFQEATARGLKADQARLEQAENAARAPYKDAQAWQAALAEQGMNEETFKVELRLQQTVNALVQQVNASVRPDSITDADLKRYYDERPQEFTARDRVRAAHILIRLPADVSAAGKGTFRKKAEGILAEIRGGADFAAVAKKSSDDAASGARGGELEPFGRGQMGPELGALEQAIRSLEPGSVSEVIETKAGYHVTKLLEKLPDDVIPLEAVKEQVRQRLQQQRQAEALQTLVNSLRAKAKIETLL